MPTRSCPNCQSMVDESQLFCPECGSRLNTAPAAAEGATQAIPRPDLGSNPSYPPQQPYGGQPTYPPQQPYGGQPTYPPQQPYGGQPTYPPQQPYGGQQPVSYQQPPAGGYPPQPPYGGQQPGYNAYPPAPAQTKSQMPLIIGIVLAVLLLGGGGAFFFLNKDDNDNSGNQVSALPTSRPQPTARPTAEPTDEPAPTDEPEPTDEPFDIDVTIPFLEDDFSTKDEGWPEQETASKTGSYAYVEDAYQISITVNERILWTSTIEEYTDVDAAIDVTFRGGPTENAAGLVVREQSGDSNPDSGSLYVFQIDGQGEYALRRFDKNVGDGEWTNVIDWTYSSAINPGLDATNRLRLTVVGSVFTLYINDQEVDQTIDTTYASGSMGFGGSTFEEGDSLFEFDNLRMAYP